MRAAVKTSIASMRSEPSADMPLEDEVLCGMTAEILENAGNGWYKVRTDYRYEGYLPGDDLLTDPDQTEIWETLPHRRIYQAYADILTEPAVQGLRIISLTRGAVVHEAEPPDADGWVRVMLCDGTKGYTRNTFLGTYHDRPAGFQPDRQLDLPCGFSSSRPSAREENAFRHNILKTAKSYLGTQYRWGGKTPLGIDCSGLTFMSYLMNGVTIYRDAQIREGFPVHEIDFADKKPGDLLFFKGHVAMYIGGDRYIHSTGKAGSDGVVINSLNRMDDDYRDDLPIRLYAAGSIF